MNNEKAYVGTFRKKNNDFRTMVFVKLEDLPASFLETKIKGKETDRKLAEGSELVWDVESDGFRVFNWNTIIGEVEKYSAFEEKRTPTEKTS
ncbi:hypothetical protein DRO91_10375 [Candidatus Heimdallarchaeota archaeon]|nr:MAG: hypothetical protein DRO91_10375 [Candidatus Heimdallarchaeota archaeon]